MRESTGPDLVHPLRPDSNSAFNQVYKEYYSALVFFACKLIRERPAAEDIVTEVFIKLWQRQEQIDLSKRAKAFLYISTRNACLNYLRRTAYQARSLGSFPPALRASPDDTMQQMVRAELIRQLAQWVENLPTQCRRVIRMSYLQGYSNREIAGKLQLSVNTVRNQKVRGIWLIRKRMD